MILAVIALAGLMAFVATARPWKECHRQAGEDIKALAKARGYREGYGGVEGCCKETDPFYHDVKIPFNGMSVHVGLTVYITSRKYGGEEDKAAAEKSPWKEPAKPYAHLRRPDNLRSRMAKPFLLWPKVYTDDDSIARTTMAVLYVENSPTDLSKYSKISKMEPIKPEVVPMDPLTTTTSSVPKPVARVPCKWDPWRAPYGSCCYDDRCYPEYPKCDLELNRCCRYPAQGERVCQRIPFSFSPG